MNSPKNQQLHVMNVRLMRGRENRFAQYHRCQTGNGMTNDQQALTDMPVWMVILLSQVGGISGEAWRADKAG
jgi:hypothetical protein